MTAVEDQEGRQFDSLSEYVIWGTIIQRSQVPWSYQILLQDRGEP